MYVERTLEMRWSVLNDWQRTSTQPKKSLGWPEDALVLPYCPAARSGVLLFHFKDSHRQYINGWAWLCSNKALFFKMGCRLIWPASTWPASTVFPGGSDSKESACNLGDLGYIPGSGIYPGEGNGNPLQHSCLENSMNRGAWWAIVHGVAKSWI